MKKSILLSFIVPFLAIWTVYWNTANPDFMINVNDIYPWNSITNQEENTKLLDWFKYEIFIMMYATNLEKTKIWKNYKALIDEVLSNIPKDKEYLTILNKKLQETDTKFKSMPKAVDETLEMILWYMWYKVLYDLYTLHWIDNLKFAN